MIEEHLHKALVEATNAGVWPLQASDKARPPFVVYGRSGMDTEATFGGDDLVIFTYEVVIVAETYAEARSMAEKVSAGLPDFKGGPPSANVLEAFLEDDSDGDPIELPGDEKPWHSVNQTWKLLASQRN